MAMYNHDCFHSMSLQFGRYNEAPLYKPNLPIWFARYDSLSVVAAQRISNLFAIHVHLVTIDLCAVKTRLTPLDHKFLVVDRLCPNFRLIRRSWNQHLNVLHVGWNRVFGEFRFNDNIVDGPAAKNTDNNTLKYAPAKNVILTMATK